MSAWEKGTSKKERNKEKKGDLSDKGRLLLCTYLSYAATVWVIYWSKHYVQYITYVANTLQEWSCIHFNVLAAPNDLTISLQMSSVLTLKSINNAKKETQSISISFLDHKWIHSSGPYLWFGPSKAWLYISEPYFS